MNNKKTLDYYMNLPWSYTVETAQENGQDIYVVSVNELSGICTDDATLEGAMNLVKEVMATAFQLYLENGEKIPEPTNSDKFKRKHRSIKF